MAANVKARQTLIIELHGKEFSLLLPKEFYATEAYEATMEMSKIILENIVKERTEIEAKQAKEEAPAEKAKEEEKSVEATTSVDEKGEE